MTTTTDELVLERRGPVLVVRLNRPEARNALTPELLSGIGAAMVGAESDPDIRVVVLTGTGDRAFCAGMDLRAFSSGAKMGGDSEAAAAYQRLIQGDLTVPVIGAANGTAVGGGLELLLGCDLIVASAQAKFGFPEVKRGLFAAGGGVFIGTRIPLGIALEMLLTGDTVEASRAYEIGLANAITAPEDVLDTAVALAERVAANAPLGLAASKELARLGLTDAARASARLKEWQSTVFTSADAKEGAAAFVEKRTPVWQGR
jgi:enoyl-CoA hydratase/carnithine racemase